MMKQKIATITLVVNDYDEAITFYTEKLQFRLIEDTKLSETKRWVQIAPTGDSETCLLLAKASNEEQKNVVGCQTGGRVFLFLHTDNIARDYQNLQKNQVTIIRPPSKEVYGTVLVFADLYGNLWDLIERNDFV
jgi:catechol 2,3-dioxygenase-like lactoylglutathione lyase family enzyme